MWGADSVETVKNLSMFNQYYQEKDYIKAFPYWMYLYNNAPCLKKRITFSGPYMLKKKIGEVSSQLDAEKEKENPDETVIAALKAQQTGLVDTVFLCYQKRIDLFGDRGAVLAEWANDLGKLRPKERPAALALFAESYSMEGVKSTYKVPKNYIYMAIKMVKKDELELDSLLAIYSNMNDVIQHNKPIEGKYQEKWVKTEEVVTKLMLPYLDCDKIVALKEPSFEANKNDSAYPESTLKLMSVAKCEKSPFYFQLSEQLYNLKPSPESALALGRAAKGTAEYAKAITYYNKALEGRAETELYDIYLQLSALSLHVKSYSNARSYARKALEISPNSAEAYMLVGDAYAYSRSACSGSKLKGHEVFWVAVDQYNKAYSVAETDALKDKVRAKINKYSAHFPDKEMAFFEGITDGSTYTVGCWIGETTIVRTVAH
jgi:tetratricopeptide (TPR) repeat protein